MKYFIVVLLVFPFLSKSQKIVENKIDEFTKYPVVRTDYEKLVFNMTSIVHYRISKIDSIYYFDYKFMYHDKVLSVNKGSELMFKTDSGEIITLKSLESKVSCKGCGAVGINASGTQGLDLSYVIPSDILNKLSNQLIVKTRFYTTDGYIEQDIKEKFAIIFKETFKLMAK